MAQSRVNESLLDRLSTLSDMARLRILRLVEQQELSVGELSKALQLPQSTVSRHLKLLHEKDWIVKRSEGTASLYKLDQSTLLAEARDLWNLARAQLGSSSTFDHDDARLTEVLTERKVDSTAFFGRVGGEWDQLRQQLFGDSFTADALLNLISPDWVVADLGCGTGNAAEHLAPLVKKVIAVDREPAMLKAARKRLQRFKNVEFRRGELADLPIKKNEVDAAMVSLVLHHIESPVDAVKEIARVLKRSGIALIIDMIKHDRKGYRHTMGHKHLGFAEKDVKRWVKESGLKFARFSQLRPDTDSQGPSLFVAALSK